MSLKLNPGNFKLKLIRVQGKCTTFKAKVLRTLIVKGVETCIVHPIETPENKINAKQSIHNITQKFNSTKVDIDNVQHKALSNNT